MAHGRALMPAPHFFLRMIWKTACDLEEFWLAEVVPEVLEGHTHTHKEEPPDQVFVTSTCDCFQLEAAPVHQTLRRHWTLVILPPGQEINH